MEADRRRIAEALGAYEVGEEIGRGAWGVVYAGRHRHLARDVAIKQLPTAFGADPALRARFTSEARLVASLDHPHIVPVYDYVERDGLYLIVMERLSGGTLWDRFSGRGIALDSATALMLAVCAALGYAHDRGILHRDIKPDNVLLTAAGVPKLTDFGIAKLISSTATAVTAAGTVVGTPAYMAPEQAQGGEIGPSTDIYACAVVLYELLAGSLPFPESADPMVQLYQHVNERPRPLGQVAPAVPAGLCDVVMRALAKSPAARHESAEELGVALAEAATTAWGPGWVERTGITVMDRARIRAATLRPVADVRGFSAPATVVVRPTGSEHPVLEPVDGEAEPGHSRGTEPEDAGRSGRRPNTDPLPAAVEASSASSPAEQSETPRPQPPGPAVLEPLARLEVRRSRRRPGIRLLAVAGAVAVAAVAVALAVVLAVTLGSPGEPANPAPPPVEGPTTAASAPPTTAPATTAPATTAPASTTTGGRSLEITSVAIVGDRYVVAYTPHGFAPRIDDTDPNQHHVHFFWNVFRPEQAGTNAAEYGATVGEWVMWDQPVFDGFAVADRPPDATEICAIVATHDHRVENPQNVACADISGQPRS